MKRKEDKIFFTVFVILFVIAAVLFIQQQQQEKAVAEAKQKPVVTVQPIIKLAPKVVPVVHKNVKPDLLKIKDCNWDKHTLRTIKAAAKKYSIDYYLVMSMAYVESRFDEKVIGDYGQAYGAWQIHPSTWREVIRKLGYSNEDMLQAEKQAEVFCYIMRAHYRKDENVEFGIMAWNGGGFYARSMMNGKRMSNYCKQVLKKQVEYEDGKLQ